MFPELQILEFSNTGTGFLLLEYHSCYDWSQIVYESKVINLEVLR